MNSLTLNSLGRRPGVMLVPVDGQFSLIDPVGEHVLIVNASAAWVWTRLASDETLPDEFATCIQGFLSELQKLEMVSSTFSRTDIEPVGMLTESPRIVVSSALQVAANNSIVAADPFYDLV